MEVNNTTNNLEENSRVTVSSTVINTPTSSNNCSPKVPQIQVSLQPAAREFVSTSVSVNRKIVGKNLNGTIVVTSAPSNDAELQLYRVMQRASLLAYYDTLLEMGGDDVQQLCDAGEEEFLEIMALVGMASKPLHVRRLQKSLQEWVVNPSLFYVPLSTSLDPSGPPLTPSPQLGPLAYPDMTEGRGIFSPSPRSMDATCILSVATSPSPCNSRSYSPMDNTITRPPSASSSPGPSITTTGTSVQVTPILTESHISRISVAAKKITKNLPQLEPKPQNTKKKMCKELEAVMAMPENDPRRMDQIRKYAAIYGRFDCKRKPEKPLTLHELSVNEAAAQMCRYMTALLTRRDELFPLARQVVRDAGYNYSKGLTQPSVASLDRVYPHDKDSNSDSNSEAPNLSNSKDSESISPNKRPRLESNSNSDVEDKCQIILKKVKEEIDSDY